MNAATIAEVASRIAYTVDVMAKAKGISQPHEIDTLVGIATRALASGKNEIQAIEAARKHADRITQSNAAIDSLLADVSLFQRQALSLAN